MIYPLILWMIAAAVIRVMNMRDDSYERKKKTKKERSEKSKKTIKIIRSILWLILFPLWIVTIILDKTLFLKDDNWITQALSDWVMGIDKNKKKPE